MAASRCPDFESGFKLPEQATMPMVHRWTDYSWAKKIIPLEPSVQDRLDGQTRAPLLRACAKALSQQPG